MRVAGAEAKLAQSHPTGRRHNNRGRHQCTQLKVGPECKDAYASVRRYKDTVAHVDQSDLKSRFNGKILNSDLRSVARSK